jgi:hypothetical protein
MWQYLLRFIVSVFIVTGLPALGQDIRGLLAGETLQFTAREPNHVAGTFTRADVTVRFEATRDDGKVRAVLLDAKGSELLSASGTAEAFAIRYLGGRLNARGVHGGRQDDDSPTPGDFDGDVNAGAALTNTSEYRILPFLSRALGANGVTGKSHPASLYLHGLGLSAAKRHGITVPPLDTPGATTCRDLRDDPCGNQCLAMCGPECTCWNWVCGDCCGHIGCYRHDRTCRLCECDAWRFGGECILCYSGVSFLGPEPCRLVSTCPIFQCP